MYRVMKAHRNISCVSCLTGAIYNTSQTFVNIKKGTYDFDLLSLKIICHCAYCLLLVLSAACIVCMLLVIGNNCTTMCLFSVSSLTCKI